MIKITNVNNVIKRIKLEAEKEINLKKDLKIKNIVQALKNATPVDTGNAKNNWTTEDNKIVNRTEYMQYLNEGSSQQAPAHFIEKTVLSQEGVRPSGIIVVYK